MVQEDVKQETVVMKPLEVKTPIDIIVPTHGNLELTMACIKNIYLFTQLPFHLIVTDDSTDLTPLYFTGLLKERSNLTYIHSDVPYKCGNQFFNVGLAHCKYEFVATIMNSVTVQPDWEIVAVEMLRRNPKVATIGLKCLFPWGTIESAGIQIVKAEEYGAIQDSKGIHTKGVFPIDIGANLPAHLLCNAYERDAVQWAFAIHRKEALIGNLGEEDIFHGFKGWDDIDNCFVLRKKGWKIFYCGSGAGYHIPRATRGVAEDDEKGIRLNQENGVIFRNRWGLNGEKPAEELKKTEPVPMNRAERRRMAKVKV